MNDEEPPPARDTLQVAFIVDESVDPIASRREIKRAVIAAASFRGYHRGEIGVRLTDDVTIRELNSIHLGHDYATDVISFGYEAEADYLSGELVVSTDTATRMSMPEWPANAELLLYVVHGTLHISGMDDHEEADRTQMRLAEQAIMTQLGFPNIRRFGADQSIHAGGSPVDDTDVPVRDEESAR